MFEIGKKTYVLKYNMKRVELMCGELVPHSRTAPADDSRRP